MKFYILLFALLLPAKSAFSSGSSASSSETKVKKLDCNSISRLGGRKAAERLFPDEDVSDLSCTPIPDGFIVQGIKWAKNPPFRNEVVFRKVAGGRLDPNYRKGGIWFPKNYSYKISHPICSHGPVDHIGSFADSKGSLFVESMDLESELPESKQGEYPLTILRKINIDGTFDEEFTKQFNKSHKVEHLKQIQEINGDFYIVEGRESTNSNAVFNLSRIDDRGRHLAMTSYFSSDSYYWVFESLLRDDEKLLSFPVVTAAKLKIDEYGDIKYSYYLLVYDAELQLKQEIPVPQNLWESKGVKPEQLVKLVLETQD